MRYLVCSAHTRISACTLDTAAAYTITLNTNLAITILAPASSPRVLDQVELFSILRTIANGKNGMVMSGTAARADNTRFVILDNTLVGLNKNRDWLLSNSSLHLFTFVSSNFAVARNFEFTL